MPTRHVADASPNAKVTIGCGNRSWAVMPTTQNVSAGFVVGQAPEDLAGVDLRRAGVRAHPGRERGGVETERGQDTDVELEERTGEGRQRRQAVVRQPGYLVDEPDTDGAFGRGGPLHAPDVVVEGLPVLLVDGQPLVRPGRRQRFERGVVRKQAMTDAARVTPPRQRLPPCRSADKRHTTPSPLRTQEAGQRPGSMPPAKWLTVNHLRRGVGGTRRTRNFVLKPWVSGCTAERRRVYPDDSAKAPGTSATAPARCSHATRSRTTTAGSARLPARRRRDTLP